MVLHVSPGFSMLVGREAMPSVLEMLLEGSQVRGTHDTPQCMQLLCLSCRVEVVWLL